VTKKLSLQTCEVPRTLTGTVQLQGPGVETGGLFNPAVSKVSLTPMDGSSSTVCMMQVTGASTFSYACPWSCETPDALVQVDVLFDYPGAVSRQARCVLTGQAKATELDGESPVLDLTCKTAALEEANFTTAAGRMRYRTSDDSTELLIPAFATIEAERAQSFSTCPMGPIASTQASCAFFPDGTFQCPWLMLNAPLSSCSPQLVTSLRTEVKEPVLCSVFVRDEDIVDPNQIEVLCTATYPMTAAVKLGNGVSVNSASVSYKRVLQPQEAVACAGNMASGFDCHRPAGGLVDIEVTGFDANNAKVCEGTTRVRHSAEIQHHEVECVSIAVCGDGVAEHAEGCDDGNLTAADGCSASCQVEAGFTCQGQPSVCSDATVLVGPTVDGTHGGDWFATDGHGQSLRLAADTRVRAVDLCAYINLGVGAPERIEVLSGAGLEGSVIYTTSAPTVLNQSCGWGASYNRWYRYQLPEGTTLSAGQDYTLRFRSSTTYGIIVSWKDPFAEGRLYNPHNLSDARWDALLRIVTN